MRFKAKLAPEQVSLLHSMIAPMSKLGGGGGTNRSDGGGGGATQTTAAASSSASCWTRNGSILYLDDTHVRFSCAGRSQDTDGMTCFAELHATGYNAIFLDHRIESNADNNAIVMELDLIQFKMALKSVLGSGGGGGDKQTLDASFLDHTPDTVLKLAKRNNIPCLCLDACSPGVAGTSSLIQVHHAIPVRIMRASDMTLRNYLPPQIPLPDVQLELDNVILKPLLDRFKSMSNVTYLEATKRGELTISIYTDGASIQTYYSQLTPRLEDCKTKNSDDDDRTSSCRVKVDTKKLCAALQYQAAASSSSSSSYYSSNHQHHQQQQHNNALVSSALLCLVENEMLVLHVNLSPAGVGFFTYYVPVHYLSPSSDDDESL